MSLWKGLTPGRRTGGVPPSRCRASGRSAALTALFSSLSAPGRATRAAERARLKVLCTCMRLTMGSSAVAAAAAAAWAGIHRQVLLGGLRIATYEPIKNYYAEAMHQDPAHTTIPVKIAAALTAGTVGGAGTAGGAGQAGGAGGVAAAAPNPASS